ncbi:MAG: site-specific integrase, partial [Alphaproteobacteria bacterium]|nr:site-specific integrase [Alphaproteobacteria bacterium]
MGASKSNKRVTKRVVDSLKPGGLVWDTDVTGFGVRCQRAAKVYVVKYRFGGRQRWHTIGRHGSPWTPEKARNRAKAILGIVADGKDPSVEREASKRNPAVKTLVEDFMREHVKAKRRSSTEESYRALLDRLVIPEIGKRRVADVTHADVAQLHHRLKATPYQANRVVDVLSSLFTWAERHGYRPRGENPCQDIEPFKEHKRDRFLSANELNALGKALSKAEKANELKARGKTISKAQNAKAEKEGEPPSAIAAIRLLVLTGCRKSEILTLQWEHVDFDLGALRLPDSKTGAKVVPLGAPALELLASLPRLEGNPYVLPGHKDGAHFVGLQKVWERVRAKAKLPDVRIHDLRHSFASVGAASGDSLLVIGALLGHRDQA